MIMGVRLVAGSLLSRRHNSVPLMPGNMRSSRTASYANSTACHNASGPVVAGQLAGALGVGAALTGIAGALGLAAVVFAALPRFRD